MLKYSNIIYNFSYKYKVDIIAITHNPFTMKDLLVVYDFEKRKIVDSDEYIKDIAKLEIKKLDN